MPIKVPTDFSTASPDELRQVQKDAAAAAQPLLALGLGTISPDQRVTVRELAQFAAQATQELAKRDADAADFAADVATFAALEQPASVEETPAAAAEAPAEQIATTAAQATTAATFAANGNAGGTATATIPRARDIAGNGAGAQVDVTSVGGGDGAMLTYGAMVYDTKLGLSEFTGLKQLGQALVKRMEGYGRPSGSGSDTLIEFRRDFPAELRGPGEGAGVIDVGDGLAVAIRIESHNHPSAVEPYQGAATGVGGIIRDVFSMGARPIALMDPLRFGPLDDARTRYLVEGVVAGISGYGNAVGVPTVGGEIVFDDCYRDNPLVNVLCLGVLPVERLVLAKAEGVGNVAVLLGSATGRDGIGGASVLASAGFSEGDEAKRPSVQVGDPTRRSASSRPVSSCSTPASRSACRISARPACRARRRRPRPRAASAWTSTSPASPSANRG